MPAPLELLILILGAYRILRFAGWDEWPPVARVRAWVIGEEWMPDVEPWIGFETPDDGVPYLPGKQPTSEVSAVRPGYRRPTLAHLVHCPFCLGAYISLAVTLAWWAAPTVTLYVLLPAAISGAIGLISKVLDA